MELEVPVDREVVSIWVESDQMRRGVVAGVNVELSREPLLDAVAFANFRSWAGTSGIAAAVEHPGFGAAIECPVVGAAVEHPALPTMLRIDPRYLKLSGDAVLGVAEGGTADYSQKTTGTLFPSLILCSLSVHRHRV